MMRHGLLRAHCWSVLREAVREGQRMARYMLRFAATLTVCSYPLTISSSRSLTVVLLWSGTAPALLLLP